MSQEDAWLPDRLIWLWVKCLQCILGTLISCWSVHITPAFRDGNWYEFSSSNSIINITYRFEFLNWSLINGHWVLFNSHHHHFSVISVRVLVFRSEHKANNTKQSWKLAQRDFQVIATSLHLVDANLPKSIYAKQEQKSPTSIKSSPA